ncbi:MAG TPA: hypothetical protein VMR49_02835, partial [Candidatus Paceibacterota bacterium]|nr:hypothetical protein [Candidatus Paceibacterota bacterium]
ESYDGTSSDNSILVFVHLQTSLSDLNLKVADLSSLDTTNATSLGSLIAEFLNDQIVMIKEATVGILHINGQVCVDDVCATKDEFKNLLLEAKGLPPLPILPSSSQTTATNPSDGTSSTPSDTTPPATSPDTTLPDTTPAVNAPAVSDPADVTTPPVPEIPAVPPADQTSAPQTATP